MQTPQTARRSVRAGILTRVLVLVGITGLTGFGTYQAGRATYFGYGFIQAVLGGGVDEDTLPANSPEFTPRVEIATLEGERDTLDLSKASGLILLFDAGCVPCGRVAPRWLELMAELPRTEPRAIAIATGDLATQAPYWRALERWVQVAVVTRDSAVLSVFGTGATPTTMVLDRGRPRLIFVGPLDRARMRQLRLALHTSR